MSASSGHSGSGRSGSGSTAKGRFNKGDARFKPLKGKAPF